MLRPEYADLIQIRIFSIIFKLTIGYSICDPGSNVEYISQ